MLPLSRRSFLGAAGFVVAAGGGLLSASAAAAWAQDDNARLRAFTHPGLLHGVADLARMKAAVAAQESPVYDGYLAFAAHARSKYTYAVQNTGQITSWGRGPTNFQNQAVADSAAAYQNALMWCVTGNRAHADKARDILNAWSASLTMVTGADGPLGAGLQAFKFVNAAELLRHSDYDGWTDADIARCEQSFLNVWYPAISGYMLYANGNWDLTSIQSILAIGVFCEERTLFEDALRFVAAGAGNGSVRGRVVTDAGQGQESGRDQGHEQLAVGLMGDAAQVAWNQGVDLWGYDDNRILANAEYAAEYNLGGDVPFTPDLDRTGKYVKKTVSAIGRGTLPPIYEMYYAHYAGVRGLDTPYTKAAVFRGVGGARVVEGSNDDLPSFGTFAYAGAKAPAATVPTAPAGVTAVGDGTNVVVAWLPSVSATTYSVRRATRPEGPYEEIASTVDGTTYTDDNARGGRTYYYTVTAANSQGAGAESGLAAASAGSPRALVHPGPRRREDPRLRRLRRRTVRAGGDRHRGYLPPRPPSPARRRCDHRPDRVPPQLPVLQDRRHPPRLPRRGRPARLHADPGAAAAHLERSVVRTSRGRGRHVRDRQHPRAALPAAGDHHRARPSRSPASAPCPSRRPRWRPRTSRARATATGCGRRTGCG